MGLTDYEQLVKNTLLSAYIRENISIEEKRKKIETILTQGADVNFKDANDKQNTALHIAASLEYIEIVTLLLYRGAQVFHKNTDGKTPLDLVKGTTSEVGKKIETALKVSLKFQEELQLHDQVKCTLGSDSENNTKKNEDNSYLEAKSEQSILKPDSQAATSNESRSFDSETKLRNTSLSSAKPKNKLEEAINNSQISNPKSELKTDFKNSNLEFISNKRLETTHLAKINTPSYNKRAGTSGVTGQLYETKILSLVMLKASTDPDIQEFYLGTNINGIGAFDDLCFRYKLKNSDKEVLVLLQAKHRDDPESRKLTVNDIRNISGDFGLPKYLDSYLRIRSKFNSKNDDPMFAGDFSDVECNFILYTPSKDMIDESLKNIKDGNSKVNTFLNTCVTNSPLTNVSDKHIFQLKYTNFDIDFLSHWIIEEKVKNLGITLMDFIINNAKFNNMLTDELIKTYHVILAQQVIDVSAKAPSGMFRTGTFRSDFFYTQEYYVRILRESCYRELVTTHAKTLKLRKKETKNLLQDMIARPSGSTLSKLFGTVLTHNDKLNKLELIEDNMKLFKQDDVNQFRENLKDIQFNESVLNSAIETLCKEELLKKEFKIPNSFGNFDMTIRSSSNKDSKKGINSHQASKSHKNKKNSDNSNTTNNDTKVIKGADNKNILNKNILDEVLQESEKNAIDTKDKDKFNQRLDHLSSKFEILFKKFQNTKIIEIDDYMVGQRKLLEEGFLEINGGIGGAVGNLLVLHNTNGFLQFNTSCEAEIAKKFSSKLINVLPEKTHFESEKMLDSTSSEFHVIPNKTKDKLTDYYVNVKIAGFPRLSFHPNDNDKLVTRIFLNCLWFYTNQAKEDKVEDILKKEIDLRYNIRRGNNLFRVHSDAIFLRFHDEIQKWWMLPGQVPYLTNERNIFDEINKFVVENPLLTILNAMYLNKVKKVDIEFNLECMKFLQLDSFNTQIINVISEVNILSGIKLAQYFKHRNHIFIDFDYILSLPYADYNKMIIEIKETKIKTLILVYETPNKKYGINEKLIQIINEFRILDRSKIITITSRILSKEIQAYYPGECSDFVDERITLKDLKNKSQARILQDAKIVFQGEEVAFSTIIDHHTKRLIKAEILWKVMNNDKIEIGKEIRIITYNDGVVHYCKRTLQSDDAYEVDTLNDLEHNVVVITGKPGMGKSTLVKNLALETKKEYPHMWIPLTNFRECSDTFCKWQEKKSDITFQDEFRLMCKVILNNDFTHLNFEVVRENNKVKLINCGEIDSLALFELELFIEYYNKGKIIFLFDDYDEVCPPYEKESLALLNTIESGDNKMWITSRCYLVPKTVLEREFNYNYSLMPINMTGQIGFLSRFFKTNINLEKLNNEQFSNVCAFLKYMSGISDNQLAERTLIPLISIPLHIVYIFAVDFFNTEINNITSTTITKTLKDRLDFDMESWGTLSSFTTEDLPEMKEVMELAGTPLHMYIAANYLKLQFDESFKIVVDKPEMLEKWDICTNAVALYKKFLEGTLKGVCLQGDISDEDDEKTNQEHMRREFLERHKKLLLLAICKEEDLKKLLKPEEIKDLKDTIIRIQNGEERSGSIDCVLDNVPRFYHLIFAEYFMVDALVDMLKSISQGDIIDLRKHRAVWHFIINILLFSCPLSIRKVFNYRLKHDPDLRVLSCKDYCKEIVFELLLKQNDDDCQSNASNTSNQYTLKTAISDGLSSVTDFFISCIKDNVNKDNINTFVNMINDSKFLKATFDSENKVFLDKILDIIVEVDKDKLFEIVSSEVLENIPVKLASWTGDEDVVEKVRTYIKKAQEQLNSDSGELFGMDRDTSNLIRGICHVIFKDLNK